MSGYERARHRLLLLAALTAPLIAATQVAAAPPGPEVEVPEGTLRGRVMNGVLAFRGIPYAAPPVGELRWRPPHPARPWSGTLDASSFAPDCMQRSTSIFALGTTEPSEDCLYLNIFRPAGDGSAALPVMVYIHGGGFTQGGPSAIVYDGTNLSGHGVVVVTIAYRLGRFGFFAHPALSREYPEEPKANYGFLDQIAALKWVRDNIARFGGDASNVTIFGQSAGAASVSALLVSPLAEGLFHKAIIQSGPFRAFTSRRVDRESAGGPSLESLGAAFGETKGIAPNDPDAARHLRALRAEDIVAVPPRGPSGEPGSRTWGGPAIDGQVLPVAETDYYSLGRFKKVPLIIGATTDDAPLPATTTDPYVKYGPRRGNAQAAYDPEKTGNLAMVAHRQAIDEVMLEPSRHIARAYAAEGMPTYEYRFGYLTEGLHDRWSAGAPHGAELAYVFDNLNNYYGPIASPRDAAVAAKTAQYWANFARTGDPNGPGLPQWPRYEANSDVLMAFKPDGTIEAQADPLKARLDLAAGLALKPR